MAKIRSLKKWSAYGSRAIGLLGQFEPFPSKRRGIANDPLSLGLTLTLGQYWAIADGGHILRRQAGAEIPKDSDPICGVSIGRNPSIVTKKWQGPGAAGSRWTYRLTAVGAAGVEDLSDRAIREVVITSGGALANPIPRAPFSLTAKPLDTGAFLLRWRYNDKDQQIAPVDFAIFAGVGSPSFASPIATVNYSAGRSEYEYETAVISSSTVEPWRFAIRARVTASRSELNSSEGPRIPGTDTPPFGTTLTVGAVEAAPAPDLPG